jgi:hypothetical protein
MPLANADERGMEPAVQLKQPKQREDIQKLQHSQSSKNSSDDKLRRRRDDGLKSGRRGRNENIT